MRKKVNRLFKQVNKLTEIARGMMPDCILAADQEDLKALALPQYHPKNFGLLKAIR